MVWWFLVQTSTQFHDMSSLRGPQTFFLGGASFQFLSTNSDDSGGKDFADFFGRNGMKWIPKMGFGMPK